MSTKIEFTVLCKECRTLLPRVEFLLAIPVAGPLASPSLTDLDWLQENELKALKCPKCGIDLEELAEAGEGQEGGEGEAVFWRVDYEQEHWEDCKERVYGSLRGELPGEFRTEAGETYAVARVEHCDLVPADAAAFPGRFGHYYVQTDRGALRLECRPARNVDGSADLDREEWYLVGRRVFPEPTPVSGKRPGSRSSVPPGNLHAYRLLYQVEVDLRWFVHETMRSGHEDRWWEDKEFWRTMERKEGIEKAPQPPDKLPPALEEVRKAFEKVRQAFKGAEERLAKERDHLYVKLQTPDLFAYLDFSDLGVIVEAFWDNFKDCVLRKKVFLGMLETLAVIRNAVAHNRPVPPQALAKLREAQEVVARVLGKSGKT